MAKIVKEITPAQNWKKNKKYLAKARALIKRPHSSSVRTTDFFVILYLLLHLPRKPMSFGKRCLCGAAYIIISFFY